MEIARGGGDLWTMNGAVERPTLFYGVVVYSVLYEVLHSAWDEIFFLVFWACYSLSFSSPPFKALFCGRQREHKLAR